MSKPLSPTPYDPLTAPHPGHGLEHLPTYWLATAGPAPADDGALGEDREAEVAIIGGGYTGLACAYFLAREHGINPIVLEANRPAWGCSGRNGSFVRPAIGRLTPRQWLAKWGERTAQALFAESLAGVETVRQLIRSGRIDCDVQPEGWLKIAHRASRVVQLEADQRLLRETFGWDSELLDEAALAARHFRGAEAYAALRSPGSFAVHPLKLAHGVLSMARAAGAVVHGASPVIDWRKAGDRHVLVTPGGRVRAKTVVLATNGYTPECLHGVTRGRLLPVLSNIIVTRPMTPEEKVAANLITTDVMTDTRELLYYYRRLPDDRMMLGGRGPITESPRALAAHREQLLAALKRKFPSLSRITVDYFWGGWVCLTWDFIPHVHCAEDDPSVLYSLGYMGSGVSFSLHGGRKLAARAAGARGGELPTPLATPPPRFPLAALRRVGQRLMFQWYRYKDASD